MRRQDESNRKAWRILEGQIDLLKTGTRATDYACREVLELALNCSAEEVLAALHRKLHKWGNMEDSKASNEWALAWVTAAKQLLCGLLKT